MNPLIIVIFIAGGVSGFLAKLLADRILRAAFMPRNAAPFIAAGAFVLALAFTLSADISYYLLLFILLAMSAADIKARIIPDSLVAAGIVLALIRAAVNGGLNDALAGAAVGALPLLVIDRLTLILVKKDGFGYGDVKLMLMCGLFLDGWRCVFALFSAFMLGGAVIAVLLALKKVKRGDYIAFGPFLAAGTAVSVFFGEAVISWYAGLLFYGL